jgi:hypothetical protein
MRRHKTGNGKQKRDHRYGHGAFTFPGGFKYIGEWLAGEQFGCRIEYYPGGSGRAEFRDHDRYVGATGKNRKFDFPFSFFIY